MFLFFATDSAVFDTAIEWSQSSPGDKSYPSTAFSIALLIHALTAIWANRLTPNNITACFKDPTFVDSPKNAELANLRFSRKLKFGNLID